MENVYLLKPKDISLKELFGESYLSSNNCDELKNNYQELQAIKEACLEEITEYICDNNPNKRFALESWKLELLLLTSPSQIKENDFQTYYNFKELSFIKLLKQISGGTHQMSDSDFELLYYYIPNRLTIEELITKSKYDILSLDYNTLNILYRLIIKRTIPIGHNIKNYERLCYKLGLSKYQQGPNLELKAS